MKELKPLYQLYLIGIYSYDVMARYVVIGSPNKAG